MRNCLHCKLILNAVGHLTPFYDNRLLFVVQRHQIGGTGPSYYAVWMIHLNYT